MVQSDSNYKPVKIILIVAASLLGAIILIYICFLPLFPTLPWIRKLRVKQYSPDSKYSTVCGKALVRDTDDGLYITLTLEDVLVNNQDDDYYKSGNEYYYLFISSHRRIMEVNGFKELLTERDVDGYGNIYYEIAEVTMVVSEGIWGDGMRPFAVAFSAGEKEYLSYETGKEKLLYYFEHEMH